MKKQQGFFALVAAALIVIIGFLGVAIAYMTVGSSTASINLIQSTKAFYIAEGGLEKTLRYLSTPSLSGGAARIACASVSGNANLTASSLGNGTFTVTAAGPFYASSATTLNGALTASATTIPVVSTANYQSAGRIMIDKELMNYAATNGTNFLGVTRAIDGTVAASHLTGTRVGQFQCDLTSTSGIPNLTNPLNKHILKESAQLQEIWAVGNTKGSNQTLTHWNRPTEATWNDGSIVGSFNLNSVSLISYVDGWAVGVSKNFLRWNGSSWASFATSMTTSTWNAVYCVKADECFAGGNNAGGNPGLANWNGSTWTQIVPGGTFAGTSIFGIDCDSSADCWAVGGSGGGKIFYHWDGAAWTGVDVSTLASGPFPFNSVFCNSSSDCWAVGTSSAIFAHKNGAWASYTTALPGGTYNSIFCNASNDCWAVGNTNSSRDLIVHWDGTSWTRDASNPTPIINLQGIECANSKDCWAVGSTASGGFVHWDGSSWTTYATSGLPATVTMNSVSIIHPNTQPQSAWSENFS